MNDTKRNRSREQRDGLFADPGSIAPSVDKAWRDDFIIELRLLSVAGDRIGDALMTVETHVRDSGESATESFGDPKGYAREIAASESTATAPGVTGWTVIGNVAGLIGMLTAVWAFSAWLEGSAVEITAGAVVGLVVLLLLVGLVLARSTSAVRLMVDHVWAFALIAPIVLIGSFVAIFFLFPQTWFELGAVPVGVAAAVLLALSVVAAVLDGEDGDLILAPGDRRPTSGLARWGTALILPFFTLLLLGLTWLLSTVG